ncbi:hypothetical protein F2Q69_00015461 [Brassica cretica]|uniref:UspA domain-containing protein n=1 Tax=Brassica cretica TaxID=69181 RepID=A0A8S9QUA7_BRACR|nr:hypothetical protein F2Q69_00015461 [Brassica cretica]
MNVRGNIPTKFSLGIFRGHFRQTSGPRNFLGNLFPRNSVGKFRGKKKFRGIISDDLFRRIEVEIRRLEGKDKGKGAKIVEEAKKQQVTLLVVGQEKKPTVCRLLKRWGWKRRRGHAGVLKYCLENASCMTIAVKPKKRKHDGYLITTKRHKNFWLLS